MKKQGYNARLDESLGERHKGAKKQSLTARRHESEGLAKKMTGHKYSAVKTTAHKAKKKAK